MKAKMWENLPLTLTVQQAAEILQCVPETVKRALRSGRLKGCKLGSTTSCSWRIERDVLRKFAEGKQYERIADDNCSEFACVCTYN